jgi:ribosomal protein S6E (S10)
MARVDRPSARKMMHLLNTAHPVGISPESKGVSSASDGLLAYYTKVRAQHPTKIMLVRVGDFYETYGYCAILLVQYAGLNPMGTRLPRAGCPVVNLRRTLADLTDAGFSVVVCEETPIQYGSKNRRKQRYIAGVTSPASPLYVHDMSLAGDVDTSSVSAAQQAPMIGIAQSARGFVLYIISLDTRSVKVMESLTLEAVFARLASGGVSPPLYLHKKISKDVAASLLKQAPLSHRATVYLPGTLRSPASEKPGSFLRALLDTVRLDSFLDVDEPFTISAPSPSTTRARPLYLSTAAQMGLVPTSGIPPLVDSLVPSGTEALVRNFFLRLLLHPPPHTASVALAAALTCLLEMKSSLALPAFPVLSPTSVSRFVLAREANNALLSDLYRVLLAAKSTLTNSALSEFARHTLFVTRFETGLGSAEAEVMEAAADEIIADIEATLVLDTSSSTTTTSSSSSSSSFSASSSSSSSAPETRDMEDIESEEMGDRREGEDVTGASEGGGAGRGRGASEGGGTSDLLGMESDIPGMAKVQDLLAANEGFVGKVQRRCTPAAMDKLDEKRKALVRVVEEEVLPLIEAYNAAAAAKSQAAAVGRKTKGKASVIHDSVNNAIWVRGVSTEALQVFVSHLEASAQRPHTQVVNPRDRNGRTVGDSVSTSNAEKALADYRGACEEAAAAVRAVLRGLSGRISLRMGDVINAITFCTIAKVMCC